MAYYPFIHPKLVAAKSLFFKVAALWLSPLNTDAPSKNKASSRLCSPTVMGRDRPTLGYKYPRRWIYI